MGDSPVDGDDTKTKVAICEVVECTNGEVNVVVGASWASIDNSAPNLTTSIGDMARTTAVTTDESWGDSTEVLAVLRGC